MSKLENDIKIGGRFWSTTTDGKIIDAEQIDGKLKMEQIEGLDPELLNSTNIEKGSGDGSNQTKDVIYTGEDIIYSDGMIGIKNGEIVEGGRALGVGAVALGGLRLGYSGISGSNIVIDGIHYKVEGYEVYYPEVELINTYLHIFKFDGIAHEQVWYGCVVIDNYGSPFEINGKHYYVTSATPIDGYEGIIHTKETYEEDVEIKPYKVTFAEAIWDDYLQWQPGGVVGTTSYYNRTSTSAEGNQSFAAGASVHAYGDFSVALGKDTTAYQGASTAIGGGNKVGMTKEQFEAKFGVGGKDNNGKTYEKSFSFGFAAGSDNKVLGYGSVALGGGNTVTGEWAVVGGANNTASGSTSVVFGIKNNSSGQHSATFGEKNTNNAYLGNVFGSENTNNAYGGTIFGAGNTATGAYSFTNGTFITNAYKGAAAFGNNLTTSKDYQVVFGQYNKDNGEAFLIVGNGASNNSRSNAFEVTSSGINLNGGPISFSDNTFYFNKNINGSRYASLWVNDVSFIPKHNVDANGKDNGGYRALSTIFSYDETTGTLTINW